MNQLLHDWLCFSLSISLHSRLSFYRICLPPSLKILFKYRLKWRIFRGFFFVTLRLCQLQLKSSKSNPVNRLLPGQQQLNHRQYRIVLSWTRPDQTVPNRTVPMIISAISAWVQLLQRLCCWRMMSLKYSTLTHTYTSAHTHTYTYIHIHSHVHCLIGWAQATRLGCQ